MLFNSYEFIFLFLPLVLLGYYVLVPRRARLWFLAAASYVFYGWWDYRFCSLLLISTAIDFVAGGRIHEAEQRGWKRFWLGVSLVSNLGLLGFFKYFDLLAGSLNRLVEMLGAVDHPLIPLLRITLPVGISFYTFQSMSYSIDIYRNIVKPARSFGDFACYVALFPQLVAGPIIRYHELADQLITRTHTADKFTRGICFFIAGLAKKVILADGAAPLVAWAFGDTPMGALFTWAGVLAYTMQIYFDFSGYSDMAVGLGLMFGFEFPQNFDAPYKAVSITDFWRRWHISLSSWLRDYLYIPLGGNQRGLGRTYFNLFMVMLLGGLWHGANWTFLLWGAYHGVLLALERANDKRGFFWWAPLFVQRAGTFILIMAGWVLFRSADPVQIGRVFRGLLGINGATSGGWDPLWHVPLTMLVVCSILSWLAPNSWQIKWRFTLWLGVAMAILFIVCVGTLLVNASSPFLYFQF